MNVASSETTWNRAGASSGYAAVVLGIAAASFERGSPPANAPAEQFLAYFSTYHAELLAQSLLFVLSAGALLWFIGCLRSFLQRWEQGSGRVSGIAFGAGILWTALQMVLQSSQAGLAMAAAGDLSPALARMMGNLGYAVSVIAYVPAAIMLAAVGVIALRFNAFPRWLGWLSVAVAAVNLVMSGGIVARSGALAPGGALTYVLYGLTVIWQIATPTLMIVRSKR